MLHMICGLSRSYENTIFEYFDDIAIRLFEVLD